MHMDVKYFTTDLFQRKPLNIKILNNKYPKRLSEFYDLECLEEMPLNTNTTSK